MKVDVEVKNKFKNKINISYSGFVEYGILKETANRKNKKKDNTNNSLNNAELLFILEHGSEVNNLPPRKLLIPVLEKHEKEVKEDLNKACHHIIMGNNGDADNIMEQLAFKLETWCKSYFREDNGWAKNAPITINGGWMRNKVNGKPVYIKGKHSDTPMIDTGELRKSIRGIFIKS